MLVITRKKSESIIIGGNIEVIISDIGSDKVKICIDAPREISILRKELVETVDVNREAVKKHSQSQMELLKKALSKRK